MTTYYYFHLDLEAALGWVNVSGHVVWYYQEGKPDPDPWTDPEEAPDGASAAVVATTNSSFSAGTPMDSVSYLSTKNPLPPPPPPPYWNALVDYMEQEDVKDFFQNAGPRTIDLYAQGV